MEGPAQFRLLGVMRVGKQQPASLMKCSLLTAAALLSDRLTHRLAAIVTGQMYSEKIQEGRKEVRVTRRQAERG